MSKTNKNNTKGKLIPKLRFPEFKDKPQWEVKELGEVTTNESSALIQGALYFVDEGYPVYGADGIVGNIDFYHQEEPYISIVKDGSGVGRIGLHPAKSSVAGTLTYIKPTDKTLYSLDFLYYLLHKIPFSLYKVGSTIPHVYYSDYKLENLPLPSLAEQERIGEFFSVLDSLIQAQSKEVQLLRLRKKGLMQKMFPYEGETTPEWRFPEFKDAPEWEVKELGEVVIRNKERNEKLEYSLVQSVSNTYGFINQNQYFNRESLASKDTSRYFVIRKGYFAYNPSRIDVGSLAYKSDDDVSIVSPLYVSFKVKNKLINERYLYSFFNTSNFSKQLIFEGSVRNTLNYEDFSQINLPLPSLAEQERIGALFSTLDSLIEAKSQRLEQLKKHKKGLMQQLFP